MLNNVSGFEKIYISCGYSDLRKGIDGFASMIQQEFKLDPFNTGILFLFCGRKTDRIKGLLWEGDGFLLLYKRLETGRFQWLRNEDEVKAISFQQYKWLMEGLSIDQKKAIKSIAPARIL
ncbi:IS66 family insertion sequence element accessory protein TnpB [Clostridium beijerinckii]|uniref:IS66 family insertion sequence element accessory protein TnpB n=1 Tax=Clostridium beijerinckii TaxID=1520 RepID=UPI001494F566|nr:IS66 family insertion sequence element accessory protein TnpB [Clostridium beijerinckii]NOW06702.1 transposase [Clostridium beijerinckii]NYC00153.1 transposase [Clostridium beijerinckii]